MRARMRSHASTLTYPSDSSNLDETVKTYSANDAKQSFGRVLDAALSEPVLIEKHNHPAAVVISPAEYDRLRGLNVAEFSAFCDRIGKQAQQRGLTEAGLARLLRRPEK